ncbi:MAG TPA: carboxylating nicotinate-nucleotide diphosphorylase, partial [Caulobacteraceae bacterium]|nr:carboxylating nicotinate-nucleotide diphosphorylase [Caulobacteraceae bacterium]
MIEPLPDLLIEPIVRAALLEDLGRAGDITSAACIPPATRMSAHFVARQAGTIAGLDCVRLAIAALDPTADYRQRARDSDAVAAGTVLASVEADARALLSAERVALNLLGRLSGVASLTAAYVRAVDGTGARIACTRKTTPGLRALEKYAVRCGGGINHRFGLDDAVLIKDNHIAACGGVAAALTRARAAAGHLVKIEIEVDTLAQLDEALPLGPDVILLDNFSLPDLTTAVARAKGKTVLE